MSRPEASPRGELLHDPDAFARCFTVPPSFFVVGAQKAGTSTLHGGLSAIEAACLPSTKETHFFNRDADYRRGPREYREWFAGNDAARVCGEVDPEYLYFPAAAARIATAAPAARIVVVLREPLARAFSQYRMTVRRGLEDLSFAAALAAEDDRLAKDGTGESWRHHGYATRGMYATQLRRYQDLFPPAQLLVVRFEDLVGDQATPETWRRILDHVGLAPDAGDLPPLRPANRASDSRLSFVAKVLHRDSALKRAVRPWLPLRRLRLRAAMVLDRWNRRPATREEMPAVHDLPRDVVRRLADEVERTGESTGLDLTPWLEGYR